MVLRTEKIKYNLFIYLILFYWFNKCCANDNEIPDVQAWRYNLFQYFMEVSFFFIKNPVEALGEFAIDKITDIANKIYCAGTIPEGVWVHSETQGGRSGWLQQARNIRYNQPGGEVCA